MATDRRPRRPSGSSSSKRADDLHAARGLLGELGYTVAAEAAGIEEALEATKNADFDLAILDADLKGQPALPVADALVTRGTPFVFATGYGEVPEPYRGWPMLTKPFQMDGLKQMLQSALG